MLNILYAEGIVGVVGLAEHEEPVGERLTTRPRVTKLWYCDGPT